MRSRSFTLAAWELVHVAGAAAVLRDGGVLDHAVKQGAVYHW